MSRAESLPHPSPATASTGGHAAAAKSALERADRIADLEAIAGDAEAASALVEAGWTPEALAGVPPDVGRVACRGRIGATAAR